MEEDNIYAYAHSAGSRYSIDELLYLWLATPYTGKQGLILRALIDSYVPALSKHYKIDATEGTDFGSFVKKYNDEQFYIEKCDRDPKLCLKYFAEQGNWSKVNAILDKGVEDYDSGLMGAAKGGHLDMVKFFLKKGANQKNSALRRAVQGGHADVIHYLIKKGGGKYYADEALYGAAKGGQMQWVEYFMRRRRIENWDRMIFGAAYGGHKEVINYILELKGSEINPESGMLGAAKGGNLELVKFFAERGAHDWQAAMRFALKSGNLELVKFFLEKGVDNLQKNFYNAASGGKLNVVKFFFEQGLDQKTLEGGLAEAAENNHANVVSFLLDAGATNWQYVMTNVVRKANKDVISVFIKRIPEAYDYVFNLAQWYGSKDLLTFIVKQKYPNANIVWT